jgi:hypothetical protein
MRKLPLALAMVALAASPALAQSLYVVPDVPTDLGGTTYLPSDIVRFTAPAYSLSLALPPPATVDALNEAFFFGEKIPATERRELARWIAARQALPGAYGQLFAGFEPERTNGIRVFTGERITSASARHILGEEACRALLLLGSKDREVSGSLQRATDWMITRVEQAAHDAPRNTLGAYCCGKCTVGLWRNILAGGLDRQEQRLTLGLSKLRAARDGDGEWRAFPFWHRARTDRMDHPARARICGAGGASG